MKKNDQFTKGALVLAFSGFLAKLLGAVYRIPLTNILGAEGIGFYQLVFPIYALLLTISSSCFSLPLSKLVSERGLLKEEAKLKNLMASGFIMLFVFGFIAMAILMLIAKPIAKFQGNVNISYAYMIIAPSILIVAIATFFKGFFQGQMNMTPTAVTQLIEQAIKMAVGLALAKIMLKKGVMYAVFGALLGVTIAELVSLIILIIIFISKKNDFRITDIDSFKSDRTQLIKVSAPILLGGLVFPLVSFIDSILIIKLLERRGESVSISTMMYGLLTGPVNSLINMPVVIALAMAIAIVPIVAKSKAMKDAVDIKIKTSLALKLSYMISIPSFAIVLVFARQIVTVLYPALGAEQVKLTIILLAVSSINIVFLSGIQLYSSLIQALGKTMHSVKNIALGGLIKVSLNIVLVKYMSIVGMALANVVSYAIILLLDIIYYKKALGKNKILFKNISKIVLISVIITAVNIALSFLISNLYILLALGLALSIVLYLLLVLIFKVLSVDEISALPLNKLLIKLNNLFSKNDKNIDRNDN